MAYIPVVDERACIAHAECQELAPDIFEVGDVAAVLAPGRPDLVLAAAEACPTSAISVIDEDSGERVYP